MRHLNFGDRSMTKNMLTSFTHNCEDVLLLRALSDVNPGFYVDVGAYDPVMDSVTKNFYDRGWRGLNLEPNPAYLDRLREHRPRDFNVGIAASDRQDILDFHLIGNTGLSTLHVEQASLSAGGSLSVSTILVKTETLATLWDDWVPPGQQVHFLKIDVEGAEDKVIAGADWQRHRPWILVIEATVPNTSIASHQEWEPLILKANYVFAYFDGVNRYYVAREKQKLLSAFDRPANPIIDNYKPFFAELIERNLQRQVDSLHVQLSAATERAHVLECGVENLEEERRRLRHEVDQLREKVESHRQLTDNRFRALWEKIVFCDSGRPRIPFRQALFCVNGQPRETFSRLILRRDGTPRAPFRKWMESSEYRDSLKK